MALLQCNALHSLSAKNLARQDPERIVLIDFGIAKDLDRRLATTTVALVGARDPSAMATPPYAPPETLDGQRGVAASIDMYAVGVMALEVAPLPAPDSYGPS